jgi:hypothetical protein
MIVVLWRTGLRVHEALALAEHDLDQRRGSILVRHGKGGRRGEVGMDAWGWEQLRPWPNARAALPVGPLFCVIDGLTRARPWSSAAVSSEFRRFAGEGHQAPVRSATWVTPTSAPRRSMSRDRPRADHRSRSRAPPAGDVCRRTASAPNEGPRERGRAFPLRPGKRAPSPRASLQPRLVRTSRLLQDPRDARNAGAGGDPGNVSTVRTGGCVSEPPSSGGGDERPPQPTYARRWCSMTTTVAGTMSAHSMPQIPIASDR